MPQRTPISPNQTPLSVQVPFLVKSSILVKPSMMALAMALLVGCGQTGPLYLPKQPDVQTTSDTAQGTATPAETDQIESPPADPETGTP